jgi:hypothetical protein
MSRASEKRPQGERPAAAPDALRRPARQSDRREGSGSPWPDEPVLHDA